MLASSSVNTPTNAALGFATLRDLTSGGGNVAVGWRSLVTTTTGQSNVAVGAQAGEGADGTDNVFVGSQSGCLVVGNQNAFLGTFSGSTQVSGDANVAIGPNVALANTSGSCQLAIGFSAADNWLTGNSTKAIKPGAGIIDCAGSCGTAGQVLTSNGSNAICWGAAGGASAATPTVAGTVLGLTDSNNAALGCNALVLNTGTCNAALGYQAGCAVTTGSSNVLIGDNSGSALTTESNNVIIGSYAGAVGSNDTVSVANGAGTLRLHVGQFGGWSVDGTTSNVGTSGQVLTSAGSFGVPSWTTIPKYQSNGIGVTMGAVGGAAFLSQTDFGPGLNSLNYVNNITLSFRAVDAVTSDVFYYFYNGSMFASNATPFTQAQLANTVIDQVAGRLTVVLDFNTGYQNKPRLSISYVAGNNLVLTGNYSWINLSGDYV
jgi:hypothetical protein